METTEDITYYFPGGYHPIFIGDVLSASADSENNESCQYRIMHKLGYGSYSTVWLEKKSDLNKAFGTLKVAMAENDLTRSFKPATDRRHISLTCWTISLCVDPMGPILF